MKNKVYLFLQDLLEHHRSKPGRVFGYLIIFLIIAGTLIFSLETTEVGKNYLFYCNIFNIFLFWFFAIEYFLRFLIAPNKQKFFFSPLALIDLLVVLSFSISIFPNLFTLTAESLIFLRMFRLLRVLQMLKIIRYSSAIIDFFKAFKSYKNELKILSILFVITLTLSSAGLYVLEKDYNGSFATIPDAIWWAVVTVSTVGYGDAVPVTIGGKILGGMVMFMGLALIAILTAIITKMFIDQFFAKKMHRCEFCRYPRHDFDAKFCKNCGNSLDKST